MQISYGWRGYIILMILGRVGFLQLKRTQFLWIMRSGGIKCKAPYLINTNL